MVSTFGPTDGSIKEILRMILEMDTGNFFKDRSSYTEGSGERERKCQNNLLLIWLSCQGLS